MYSDQLIKPWLDEAFADRPAPMYFDSHTHVGVDDPSGFWALISELVGSLDLAFAAGARGLKPHPAGEEFEVAPESMTAGAVA